MRLPVTGWKRTLRTLGYKVVWGKQKKRKSEQSNQAQYGPLEPRKMLATSITGFEGTPRPFSVALSDIDATGDYQIRLSDDNSSLSWQWSGSELSVTDQGGLAQVELASGAAFILSDNGSYDLTAELLDNGVVVDSEAFDVSINEIAAVVEVSADSNYVAGSGDFNINFSAFDPGNDPIDQWLVSWGDGTTETFDGTVESASHDYGQQLGPFEVKVTATNTDGQSVTAGLALDSSFGVDGKVTTDFFTGSDSGEAVLFSLTEKSL